MHDHHQRFEMHDEGCLNDLISGNVQNKANGELLCNQNKSTEWVEQGTCYFFSYSFYNAVHWKRRDGEKKTQCRKDEGVAAESAYPGQTK